MDESAVTPSLNMLKPGISGSTIAAPVSPVASDGGGLVAVNTVGSDDEDTRNTKQKKTVKKRKTEPTNPYLQFVKSRENTARDIDPQSKLNKKEKVPFREMFQKEKGVMVNDFRSKGLSEVDAGSTNDNTRRQVL